MTLNDYLASRIRTVVPVVVGAALAALVKRIPAFDGALEEAEVSAWLVPLVIAVYYNAVRWAEKRYPQAGWLLGLAKQPEYTPKVALVGASNFTIGSPATYNTANTANTANYTVGYQETPADHEVPGELLALHEELEKLGISPAEFAQMFEEKA